MTASAAYLIFAQRTDARVEIGAWDAYARRFFATRLGLAADRRYPAGASASDTDTLDFVVAPDGESPGIRTASARPADPDAYALADALDPPDAGRGLSFLARRCGMLWVVSCASEPDPLALRLAAILAGVLLGPIIDPTRREIFGVKTARAKLEAARRPQITRS